MFYIFNKDKQCISSCNAKPNAEDLATREEFVVEDSRHLNISAVELHDNNAQIIDNGDYYETIETTVREPTIEEIKVSTLLDIKQKLTSTDYKQAKFIDGALTAEEYEPIKTERANLRNLYNEIEAVKTIEELNALIAGGE